MDVWRQQKRLFLTSLLFVTGFGVLIYLMKKRKQFCQLKYHSVCVCDKVEDWNSIEDHFLTICSRTKILGLDCEWSMINSKPGPVGLLQLATAEDLCLLIRLNKLHPNFSPQLRNILEDKRVLKIGVGVQNDAKKLLSDHGLVVSGCLDLRHLVDYGGIKRGLNIQKMGLQELAKVIAGITLNKSFHVRCSNWDADELSSEQINYAVADAGVAIKIFTELMTKYIDSNHYFIWRTQTLTQLYEKTLTLFGHFIDRSYCQKAVSPAKAAHPIGISLANVNELSKSYSVRTTPLYRNCHLLAPDGELLCTCDIKKLQWYLDKQLGEIVNENPFTVRLYFEPSGRPTHDNRYYTLDKSNICVVCGSSELLIRKVVVPHEYRKHFPKLMKNSLSHDVLLLCVTCHKVSNAYDSLLRQTLAKKYDAPIGSDEEVKLREDPLLKKVKSAGRALLLNKSIIPENRVKALEEIVANYYEVETLTCDILTMAANMETCIPNENFTPHGLKVVQAVSCDCGLIAFETVWRKHFLDTMNPRHLPEMWSIDHNHERLAQQISEMSDPGFDVSILGLPRKGVR